MDYIEANQEHFSLFIEDDEDFDTYLHRMRRDKEWGGHPELYAASQVLQVCNDSSSGWSKLVLYRQLN